MVAGPRKLLANGMHKTHNDFIAIPPLMQDGPEGSHNYTVQQLIFRIEVNY